MQVNQIISQIDIGAYALPKFQRGYVWNRAQVRGFMDSLYREYPVGSLLTWRTRTENVEHRGGQALQPGTVQLLLDGQQRITTLYGLIRGTPPPFFDGKLAVFDRLMFHLEDELFEYWQPVKMRDDDRWIDVIEIFKRGVGEMLPDLMDRYDSDEVKRFSGRLNRVDQIKNRDFHVEDVTGEDKSIEVVVEIFNRVNSGGTKLSAGDLALAKLCAEWPQARARMKDALERWNDYGYPFTMDFLLRVANAVITRKAPFSALADVSAAEFESGLAAAVNAVDRVLNELASRLGIDHGSVLPNPFPIVVLARFLVDNGMSFGDSRQRDRLMYWYVQAAMWGRYASSTETKLAQDLLTTSGEAGDPVDGLIVNLLQQRGDLRVKPDDFRTWSRGARFYPILYMLTRSSGARDWGTGQKLDRLALGGYSDLELHHIFPKSLLYARGHGRAEVNALANFTFLTKQTNQEISARNPADYLVDYGGRFEGALESTWVPNDPELWELDRYEEFLAVRRELLAEATNRFLDGLLDGSLPESGDTGLSLDQPARAETAAVEEDDTSEALNIAELRSWLGAEGLDLGELNFELSGDDGSQLAVFDVAWPTGLQSGLSEPIVLLIDEPDSVYRVAVEHGFLPFTDVGALRAYAESLVGEGPR